MLSYPVRIALIAALGGFLFGFETVVISGAEQTLEKFWQLNGLTQGFTVASSIFGTVFGASFAGFPARKYGRKKTLQVLSLFFIVAALGCALVSAWGGFIAFRIIGGLAVGASSVIAPMYISEIAPARLRGRLTGSFQVSIVTGIMVAYLTNYLFTQLQLPDAWRWMLGVMVIPAVLFAVLLFGIPESPRWLILNNNIGAARPILARLGETDLSAAVNAIQDSVKEHRESLFQRRYAKPILYAMLLAMFNQLSGINAILYYAPRIFQMAGFDKSQSFSQPIYIGVANLVFTLLAMTMIDKFGRKTLLIIGSLGMILFLTLTAFTFKGSSTGNSNLLYYLIGFIAFFAFSQGAVIWVFISEIFPNSVRSQGVSLGSTTHWVMAAIITSIFPLLVEGKGDGGFIPFIFFAVMMVLQLIFVWRVMPETRGRTLEEIQKDLGIS
ncbi:sugar porter family MFS transporter [Puia dinghuensis]|uniref:MFS transporter n=1 Tax=Puia dinghuensis TaxID=1792502 RepID=A0A8J2XTI3_9BACT|nr:sugar porter family MFS transporter [Puia dinghuensis]GGA99587.1 MFS transporter [Puia dinghuensis]